MKRIKLYLEDNENQVYQKLISDDLFVEGDSKGYPKLNGCGGSELVNFILDQFERIYLRYIFHRIMTVSHVQM